MPSLLFCIRAGMRSRGRRRRRPRSGWLLPSWTAAPGCWASGGGASATRGRGAPPGRRWRWEVRCWEVGVGVVAAVQLILRCCSWSMHAAPRCQGLHLTCLPKEQQGRQTSFLVLPAPLPADFRAVALGSWGQSVLLGDGEGTLAHWDTGKNEAPDGAIPGCAGGTRRLPCACSFASACSCEPETQPPNQGAHTPTSPPPPCRSHRALLHF